MASSKGKLTRDDYERIGRDIEMLYLAGQRNKRRLLALGFLRGLAQGFGAVVGASIVVAMVLWVLGFLTGAPLIGEYFKSVKDSINETIEP